VLASSSSSAARALDDPDYSLVKALQTAQQNFVITDPAMPDNPIVYASQGFLTLTGYTLDQVLGRNCRFLQGPQTNPRSVDKIRHGIEKGEDTTVVLLNYRRDGSTFWNQFFIAALRDGEGKVVNYLGVQCMVSEEYAQAFVSNAALEDSKK
jgi:PAS domain S-box-containing protein